MFFYYFVKKRPIKFLSNFSDWFAIDSTELLERGTVLELLQKAKVSSSAFANIIITLLKNSCLLSLSHQLLFFLKKNKY